MKQITKNLLTYAVEILLKAETLAEALKEKAFAAVDKHASIEAGFVPALTKLGVCDKRLVVSFPGGWAALFREDVRKVPKQTVDEHLKRRCVDIEAAYGRKPGKRERRDLRDEIVQELTPQAFTNTKLTEVVYSTASQRLYVNTTSQKTADRITSALVGVLASAKFTTVCVSGPKMGLTKRLLNWLNQEADDQAFGDWEPIRSVVLANTERKWSVKDESLRNGEGPLRTAIERLGAEVAALHFMDADGVEFKVTANLRVQGIKHRTVEDSDDTELVHAHGAQLACEVVTLDGIFSDLLYLLSPEKAQMGELFGDTQ